MADEAPGEVMPGGGVVWDPGAPAPWGSPPTPLLPHWFRENLASVLLPEELRDSPASVTTVGDLGQVWKSRSKPLGKAARNAIVGLVGGYRPPPDCVVVPAGFDHAMLVGYPLRSRTSNGLRRGDLLAGNGGVTVGELLSIPYFGIASLLDLMCVMEAVLHGLPPISQARTMTNLATRPVEWDGVIKLMKPLLAATSEFSGAKTLGDAFGSDLAEMVSALGLSPAFDAVSILDLVGDRRPTDQLLARVAALLETMSAAEWLILDQRLLSPSQQTLEQLGRQLDVTRERVRQIETRLTRRIAAEIGPHLRVAAALIHQQLGHVVSLADLDRRVADLFSDRDRPQAELASRLLKVELGYSCENAICLDQEATMIVDDLRGVARSLADEVGLVSESELQVRLPPGDWDQHWRALVDRCHFQRLSGQLALRDTAKARVKALLLSIGQPTTPEEIAELCELDANRIRSHLSVIPGVVRADKRRWGLAEWIDDEYQGIPAEIMQRIDEDGGATSLDRLVDELPRLFGVLETSVRAYVGTLQFVQRDGFVSLANISSLTFRDFEDVIHGRDENGTPYWTFVVEERYFDGYSLVGVPPELARELGCEPNDSTRVQVVRPPNSGEISVNWKLSSLTGASLGYLAGPLRQIGARGGDRVRVILRGSEGVELRRVTRAEVAGNGPEESADSLLERMKNRRRIL